MYRDCLDDEIPPALERTTLAEQVKKRARVAVMVVAEALIVVKFLTIFAGIAATQLFPEFGPRGNRRSG